MRVQKLLNKMRQNKRNWTMQKLLTVANMLDVEVANNGTSHYVFKYSGITNHLSIPEHKKDIHPDYITKFLRFMDKVIEMSE